MFPSFWGEGGGGGRVTGGWGEGAAVYIVFFSSRILQLNDRVTLTRPTCLRHYHTSALAWLQITFFSLVLGHQLFWGIFQTWWTSSTRPCCTKGVPGESIYKGQLNSSRVKNHASSLLSSPVSQTVYFSRTSKLPSRRKASTCPSRWSACRKTAALRHFHHCLREIKLNRGPLVALADFLCGRQENGLHTQRTPWCFSRAPNQFRIKEARWKEFKHQSYNFTPKISYSNILQSFAYDQIGTQITYVYTHGQARTHTLPCVRVPLECDQGPGR